MDEDDSYVVMPFVLTELHGGDYRTEDFSAGWYLGELDMRASIAASTNLMVPTVLFKSSWRTQVDLIAMTYGMTVREAPHEDREGYSYFTLAYPEVFDELGL